MFAKLKQILTQQDEKSHENSANNQQRQADLAAVALMIAVSNADHQVDQREVDSILKIASETIKLSDEDVQTFFNEAERQADASISYYEFTDVINRVYGKAKRFGLIENMWRVAYADGELDKYEDSTIRKVAELLYVSHANFIKAKHIVSTDLNQT